MMKHTGTIVALVAMMAATACTKSPITKDGIDLGGDKVLAATPPAATATAETAAPEAKVTATVTPGAPVAVATTAAPATAGPAVPSLATRLDSLETNLGTQIKAVGTQVTGLSTQLATHDEHCKVGCTPAAKAHAQATARPAATAKAEATTVAQAPPVVVPQPTGPTAGPLVLNLQYYGTEAGLQKLAETTFGNRTPTTPAPTTNKRVDVYRHTVYDDVEDQAHERRREPEPPPLPPPSDKDNCKRAGGEWHRDRCEPPKSRANCGYRC